MVNTQVLRPLLAAAMVSGAFLCGGACKNDGSGVEAAKPAGLPAASGPAPTATTPEPAPPSAAGAEMVPDAPDPGESVTGTIQLASAQKKAVESDQTMWLVVRASGGKGGPPLAIQRMTVADFPVDFLVSGRDAMIKGIPFAGEVDITVRVDRDGNPMTHSKGEVFGEAKAVKVGSSGVVVNLDQVQVEDQMLGGGRPMGGGAKPPGHP